MDTLGLLQCVMWGKLAHTGSIRRISTYFRLPLPLAVDRSAELAQPKRSIVPVTSILHAGELE